MLLDGKMQRLHYFGEWSDLLDAPHGRGIWFGSGVVRIGYFTKAACSDGKVIRVKSANDETFIAIGTETFVNGQTHTNVKNHVPGRGKGRKGCWEGKWVDAEAM